MKSSKCRHCGATVLEAEPFCPSCGGADAVFAASEDETDNGDSEYDIDPPPRSGWRSWFDLSTPSGQRRTAFVSGALMLVCVALLIQPIALPLLAVVAMIMVWEWLAGSRERARERQFIRDLEAGGGDKTALRAALGRLHRPPSVVKGPRGADIPIAGFDGRLDDNDDSAR